MYSFTLEDDLKSLALLPLEVYNTTSGFWTVGTERTFSVVEWWLRSVVDRNNFKITVPTITILLRFVLVP